MQSWPVMDILRERQAKILLIGSETDNPLSKYADLKLNLPTLESHYDKISAFATKLSLLYMLDNLYTGLFNLNYEENMKKKKEAVKRIGEGRLNGIKSYYENMVERSKEDQEN